MLNFRIDNEIKYKINIYKVQVDRIEGDQFWFQIFTMGLWNLLQGVFNSIVNRFSSHK
jgi:hypothetical protein